MNTSPESTQKKKSSGNVAVDELLEHERVVRLLDELVHRVAVEDGAVRLGAGELEEPAAQAVLEGDAEAQDLARPLEAEARLLVGRKRRVPRRRAERVRRGEAQARVTWIDARVGRVPVDVAVRLVALRDGHGVQAGYERAEGLAGVRCRDHRVSEARSQADASPWPGRPKEWPPRPISRLRRARGGTILLGECPPCRRPCRRYPSRSSSPRSVRSGTTPSACSAWRSCR